MFAIRGESAKAQDNGSLTIEEEWLDTDQAANYLKVSKGELLNRVSRGQVPRYKLGRRNLYLYSELKSLVLAGKPGGYHGN